VAKIEHEEGAQKGEGMQQQLTRPNTPSKLVKFILTGQILYPIKIMNHLRSLEKIKCLMRIWKRL
jgi:hypothetical protein